mmetsp:Transcript_8533/g.12741  ORF Transcript_8533/g.12741 Transcript_8533/m.12741 type:complete len:118 (+) Transcript_8533:82-435(+)
MQAFRSISRSSISRVWKHHQQAMPLCAAARKFPDPRWQSDAQARIAEVPVIEVPGTLAVCEGGSGALGHPIQYIQLDRVSSEPATCLYCGLRYKMGKRYNRFGKELRFEAPMPADKK